MGPLRPRAYGAQTFLWLHCLSLEARAHLHQKPYMSNIIHHNRFGCARQKTCTDARKTGSQSHRRRARCVSSPVCARQIPHSPHAHRHTPMTQGTPMKCRRKVIKQGSGCSLSRALHCWAKLTSAHTHRRTHCAVRLQTHTLGHMRLLLFYFFSAV